MNIATIARELHDWMVARQLAPDAVTVALRCNTVRQSARVLAEIQRDLYVSAGVRASAADLENLTLNGLKFVVTDPDSEARGKP